MATIGEAFIEVKPDSKGFGPDTERTVLSQVKGIAAKAAVIMGGAFVVKGAVNLFGDALVEAEDARKTLALTNAVIESTGGVAGVSAESLSDLAGRLSNLSAVDDEVIQSAGNVLLTFTQVKNGVGEGNDVFDQATEAALNMSAALGTDLQGATMQLGKALNDPIKGMASLGRAGVQFTDQQKEQVKALVEQGDVMGAQKIILKELETQFGGAAEAAAAPLDRLKVAYGNLKESLGTAVTPGLTAAIPGIQAALEGLTPAFESLGTVVGESLSTIMPTLVDAIGPIAGTLASAFGSVVEGLAPAFDALSGAFGEAMSTLGPVLVDAIGPLSDVFGGLVVSLSPIIGMIGNALEAVVPIISEVLGSIGALFNEFIGPLLTELGPVFRQLTDAFSGAFDQIIAALGPTVEALMPVLGELATTLGGALGSAVKAIAPILPQIASAFAQIIPVAGELVAALAPVIGAFVDALAPVLPQIAGLLGLVGSVLGGAIGDVLKSLTPLFTVLADTLADLAPVLGQVAQVLAGALGAAIQAVVPVVEALVEALGPIVEALAGALAPILPIIVDLLGTLLEALSPIIGAALPLIEALAPLAELLGEVLVVAVEALTPILEWLAEVLAGALGAALEAVAPLIETFAELLADLGQFLTSVFQGDWSAAWEAIKDVVAGVWELIVGIVSVAWDLIAGVFTAAWDLVSGIWSTGWNGLVGVVSDVWDGITDTVSGAWDRVTGFFTSAINTIRDLWSRIWSGLTQTVSGVFDGVVGFVAGLPARITGAARGMWDGLTSGLKGILNAVISLWNKLDFGIGPWQIPSWVPGIGGQTFGIKDVFPDIPLLASGAVITSEFGSLAQAAGLLVGHPGHDQVTRGPTLAVLGEAGGEVVLPLTNRRRLIELLLQALGLRSTITTPGSVAGIPAFAAGGIVGASIPSTGDGAANLDALMRLIEALLAAAGLDRSAVASAGIVPPDSAAFERLVASATAAGAAVRAEAGGVVVPLGAFTAAAGLTLAAGSNLGDGFTVTVVAPPTGPTAADVVAATLARSDGTDRRPFIVDSFPGFPAAQLAMFARRGPQSELEALGRFLEVLAARQPGNEFYKGLVYDRTTGRVLGWAASDEDEAPISKNRPAGWVPPPLVPAKVAPGSILDAATRDRIRAAQDESAGLVRATLTDFIASDFGVVGRTEEAHRQGFRAIQQIPGVVARMFTDDYSGTAVLPGGIIVTFDSIESAGSTPRTVPAQPDDPAERVAEARRLWAYLGGATFPSDIVAASKITEANIDAVTEALPDWLRAAVLAAGRFPSSMGSLERAGIDLPAFLARVRRLGDGGIVQPSGGGTLAFLAERGQAEAVIPLPPGFDPSQLAGTSTVDRSTNVSIERLDLSRVRDADRVPSVLVQELDLAVWQNS